MWGDPNQKSLTDMLDGRVDQFGGGNLMGEFLPKTELDPEGSLQMYGGPGPGTSSGLPGQNNMGPQLTQHSMFSFVIISFLQPVVRSLNILHLTIIRPTPREC